VTADADAANTCAALRGSARSVGYAPRDPSKGTSLIEPVEPVLPNIETTRFTAEQWKSRAMYEEACKLSMERALARAMDALEEALFAAAHVRQQPLDDLIVDRPIRPVDLAATSND
jgi:hypothetical protein